MVASVDKGGLLQLQQHLKPGSRVRLVAGPFAEQLGVLDRLDDNGRIRVLLEIMGGVYVTIQREFAVAS